MDNTKDTKLLMSSRLKLAREQAGLSQAQAASLLNIPRPSISEIEAGRRKVSADELLSFADVYMVDLNWLAGRDADEVNTQRDKLLLAARSISSLKSEDIEKVISLLESLKSSDIKK